MAATEAGKRGRSVLVLEKAAKPAEKIRISGGGRCNFTNLHAAPANYLSEIPRFCVSALKRFTQYDFIARVEAAGVTLETAVEVSAVEKHAGRGDCPRGIAVPILRIPASVLCCDQQQDTS